MTEVKQNFRLCKKGSLLEKKLQEAGWVLTDYYPDGTLHYEPPMDKSNGRTS